MPYAVAIGREEAEFLREHAVTGLKLEGSIMEFDVSHGMKTTAELMELPDCRGRSRLIDRCASLYGRFISETKRKEAPSPAAFNERNEPESLPLPFDNPTPEQVTTPRRKRRG